jgi:hypothetical protein
MRSLPAHFVSPLAGTDSSGNGDLKEVLAFDSSSGSMSDLQDLLYARFDFQLVTIPGGDVLAISGGQHVNNTEVPPPPPCV